MAFAGRVDDLFFTADAELQGICTVRLSQPGKDLRR